jgi:hypothetical protein
VGRRLIVKPGTPVSFTTFGDAVFEGDFEYKVEDLDAYVQVSFDASASALGLLYTYRDPSGGLLPGDRVKVPGSSSICTVRALGRGNWDGPVKDVRALLIEQPL